MPPVSKAGGSAFRKDVEFVTKEDDEQIAAGIVMVPDKVDLQGDFAREETIRGFADQFETFVEAGEAGGGVMHAVFPDDWMGLERNEVLDESTEIGGTEAPAGAWVQEWRIDNADLWELIADGVLEGYSIGAIQVEWNGPFEQDEADDVAVPDAIGEDEPVWELADGTIREVSAVDIPAVPDAQILETKADAEKRLGDYLGDRDGFVSEALDRGHSEAEAERLWDVLNAATEAEGSAEPGKQSLFARIGKAAVDTFLGGEGDGSNVAETPDADPRKAREKEGRTLSRQNEDDLKAVIDAATSIFRDAGKEPGITRFTDREDDGFDLSEHTAREFADPDEDEDEDIDVSPVNNASGGDTPDDDTTMTDDTTDDPMEDAPEWAKAIHDQTEENSKRIDEALEDEEKSDDPLEDAPEWAKALHEQTEKNADRIDDISKQTGATESQQLGGAEKGGEAEGGIGDRQKFFIPASKRGGL